MSTYLLLIASILKIIPLILEMIRDGRIREATTTEVLAAFEAEFLMRWNKRIADARAASGVSDELDPNDRATGRKETGADSSK